MDTSSLEGIQWLLRDIDKESLIDLALDFDLSPMQYYTRQDLDLFDYTKEHYVSQLSFAFFENSHRIHYLHQFLAQVEAKKAKVEAPASMPAKKRKMKKMASHSSNNLLGDAEISQQLDETCQPNN